MSAIVGYVTAGLQLGLESLLIKPRRGIGSFKAQATIEERHTDELEITDHPVEMGAQVSDHSYLRPVEVVIKCGWSNSPSSDGILGSLGAAVTGTIAGVSAILSGNSTSQVKEIYTKLLELQATREPFTVYTGKRVYTNMLFKSLVVVTDDKSEHSLMVTAVLRQIIIVTTKTLVIAAPASSQASPETTAPPTNGGDKQLTSAPTFNESQGASAFNPSGVST